FSPRLREADLPAKRAPAEASSRLSRADVVACRAGDSQAPSREGPEAALRLTFKGAQAESPVSLAGLRRRLPASALDVDTLSRSLWVGARGRAGRAAARAGRSPSGGKRGGAEQDQAAAP